jgi:putative alpha-1,2-mannosidase
LPFGFAKVSPDTADPGAEYTTTGYDSEGEILGFSQTHVRRTGGRSKYGNFRMTPFVGEFRLSDLNSPKSAEIASPGYYSVMLDRDESGSSSRCPLARVRMFPVWKTTAAP